MKAGSLMLVMAGLLIFCLCISGVSAVAPVASFSGTPTLGTVPLTVAFSDDSTGSPTGWSWFFGDEEFTEEWTQENASAGWTARQQHTSLAMPDGSIVLMGGLSGGSPKNDVWRSTDNGATWKQVTASAGWSARYDHSSVVMPDGSIVLMGGFDSIKGYKNDVWQSTDYGETWTLVNASAGWTARQEHSSVVMPDGSIVLMGGSVSGYIEKNDTWRSTDNGTTWTQITPSAGWSARYDHSSVVMPDGSIVLTGGYSSTTPYFNNDVWRSTDYGATWAQITTSPGWVGRYKHSCVVMPDGSIVLMGGQNIYGVSNNDVWRSKNNGTTWTKLLDAEWVGRYDHSSVVMPDGSIVLMGGGNERRVAVHTQWIIFRESNTYVYQTWFLSGTTAGI